jgi:hypothetical protein
MTEIIKISHSSKGIIIDIPTSLLVNAANGHPDGLIVTDEVGFIEEVAFLLENDLGGDSASNALTGLQELLDKAIESCSESGTSVDLKENN